MSGAGRTTVEVTLDGDRYLITKLPAMSAYRLSIQLLDKIGPSLETLAKMIKETGSVSKVMEKDMADLLPMVGQLASRISPDELESMTRELFACVQLKTGGKLIDVMEVFDAHFYGRVFTLYKLFFHAAKVNFADFGEGRGVNGTAPSIPTQSQSETSDTSAGPPSA